MRVRHEFVEGSPLAGGPVRRPAPTLQGATLALLFTVSAFAAAPFDDSARDAHAMLTTICDRWGGRMTGSSANRATMGLLASQFRSWGLVTETVPFTMPGWERGEDRVSVEEPFARPLRVAALAYTEPHEAFTAQVVSIGTGQREEYPTDVRGKVLLLDAATTQTVREFSNLAAERGAKGVLFINREAGGQLLARTGSFIGETLKVPVYSLAQEDGLWLKRMLPAFKDKMVVRMETRSRSLAVHTSNLVVRFPGKSPERIIVGAHFDSWDLGQGALDNGLGIAQLYALAKALRGRELARTVELVWFNGEEQGLWGSRYAAANLGDAPIVAMINLDMVGVPIAVNALGDESLVPALERWNAARGEAKLPQGVQNINWFGSDHTPYQLAGVRTITFNAPIPRDSVRYYHDFADTIDKLPKQIVVDSTAVIGDLVLALASDPELGAFRRSPADTEKLFTTFNLERRMEATGFWPRPPSHPQFHP